MKRYIVFLLILGCQIAAIAQNTGYGGKRFFIKADVLHGKEAILPGVELETADLEKNHL